MQLTANQQEVLRVLSQTKRPLSAYGLLEMLRKPGFKAPTQVYRALDRLVQLGLVHRLETLNAYVACSSPAGGEHSRFMIFAICDTCENIDEFVDHDLNHSLGRWAKSHPFALGSTPIELHGQCATCTRRTRAES